MKVAVYLAVGVLASFTLSADTISVSSGASWTPFSSVFNSSQASPVQGSQAASGTPFWNNWSTDAGVGGTHNMNIGYMLSGTGGFAGSDFLGGDTATTALLNSNDSDPGSETFTRNTAQDYTVTLLGAYSGNSTMAPYGTQFGIYYQSGGQTVFDELYGPGANAYTDKAAIDLSTLLHGPMPNDTVYGFYATVCYGALVNNVCQNQETYYSNSGQNSGYVTSNPSLFPGVSNYNHFAVFGLNSDLGNYGQGNWVIAFKDGPVSNEGLGDFNDIVIELADPAIPVPGVPEPATLGIVGSGLAGLAIVRRRFAKN